jgi:hypothetical protein
MDIEIRNNHSDYLKKYFFSFIDSRNFYLIRYFTQTTKGTNSRLYPIFSCGYLNNPRYESNVCSHKLKERDKIKKKIEKIFINNDMGKRKTLYYYFPAIYFTMDKINNKDRTSLINILKSSINKLIIVDKSKNILEKINEVEPENEESFI